jgi:hypothetical protein
MNVRKRSKRRRNVAKQNANVWRRRKNVASVSHRFSVGDQVAMHKGSALTKLER